MKEKKEKSKGEEILCLKKICLQKEWLRIRFAQN